MTKVDPAVLADALRTAGAVAVVHEGNRISARLGAAEVTWIGGKLSVVARDDFQVSTIVGRVRRAYTGQAFQVAAKRAGFAVKQDADGRMVATRRRF